jgi:hypothetical protein
MLYSGGGESAIRICHTIIDIINIVFQIFLTFAVAGSHTIFIIWASLYKYWGTFLFFDHCY